MVVGTSGCLPLFLRFELKKLLCSFFGVMKFLFPLLYLVGAASIWARFVQSSPDALADIGLVVYTFPIVAIGSYLLDLEFPYVSGGYIESRALYYWPSVALVAYVLYSFFSVIQEVIAPGLRKPRSWKR